MVTMEEVATAGPERRRPTDPTVHPGGGAFRHEALLYAGESDFLASVVPFVREGVVAGEPVMVAVSARKIACLRAALGADAGAVRFADMEELGANPARIIPAWRKFVDEHAGECRAPRGVGEPVWRGRRAAELDECVRHEALLNVAFADGPEWSLLCPYDVSSLAPDVVEEAHRSHPLLRRGGTAYESATYVDDLADVTVRTPLPDPPDAASTLVFWWGPLDDVRELVTRHADEARISAERAENLVLAVNEVATNSLRYGGGRGTLRAWRDHEALVCDVRDGGHLDELLIGREHPSAHVENGRGLWIANQLCDLVQVRSSTLGTTVRLRAWID